MKTWDSQTDTTSMPDRAARRRQPADPPVAEPEATEAPRRSRRRGAVVIGAALVVVVAAVLMAKLDAPGASQGDTNALLRAQQAGAGATGLTDGAAPLPSGTIPASPGASASAQPGAPGGTSGPKIPAPDPNSPKPNAANTGPRYATTRTLTASAAMTELRAKRTLSRVKITGGLTLNGADGKGWVISDSIIESRGATYAVKAYVDTDFSGKASERPVFQNVEVRGAAVTSSGETSSLFYGSDTVWRRSELYGGVDIFKLIDRVVIEDSYAYGLHHPDGAHADVIQIREGRDSVIQRNTFSAIVGYGSNPGQNGNAVLQTGSMTGPLTNVAFINNWVNGGNYILNVGEAGLGYTFSGNKFGRSFRYMAVMGSTTGKSNGTNVWEDNGQKVF